MRPLETTQDGEGLVRDYVTTSFARHDTSDMCNEGLPVAPCGHGIFAAACGRGRPRDAG
jgi:hypothetical protein